MSSLPIDAATPWPYGARGRGPPGAWAVDWFVLGLQFELRWPQEAGCDEYLIKPVDPVQLETLLAARCKA